MHIACQGVSCINYQRCNKRPIVWEGSGLEMKENKHLFWYIDKDIPMFQSRGKSMRFGCKLVAQLLFHDLIPTSWWLRWTTQSFWVNAFNIVFDFDQDIHSLAGIQNTMKNINNLTLVGEAANFWAHINSDEVYRFAIPLEKHSRLQMWIQRFHVADLTLFYKSIKNFG
jgi:hypothetical protein